MLSNTVVDKPSTQQQQQQRIHLYSKLTTQDRIHIIFFAFTIIANSAFKCFTHINIHLLSSHVHYSFQLTQVMLLIHVISFAIGRLMLSMLSVFMLTTIMFNVVMILNLVLFATNMVNDTCNIVVVVCYAMISGICGVGVVKHVWGVYPFNKAFAVAVMLTLDLLGNAVFIVVYDYIGDKRMYFLIIAGITMIGVCCSCKLKHTTTKVMKYDVVSKMKRCNEIELTTTLNNDNNSDTSSISYVSALQSQFNSNNINISACCAYVHSYIKHIYKHLYKTNQRFIYIACSFILITSSTYIISMSYISYYILTQHNNNVYTHIQHIHYMYYISGAVISLLIGIISDVKGIRYHLVYITLMQIGSVVMLLLLLYNSIIPGVYCVYICCILNAGAYFGVICLYLPFVYKETSDDVKVDAIVVMVLLKGITEYICSMFMKAFVYDEGTFRKVYMACIVMAIGSVVMMYKKVNVLNVIVGNDVKRGLIEQDEVRELRKE